MTAYYNENNKYAASRLRYLIANNLIAPGDVDERSITEVKPDEIKNYTQCHFFAGIGGWSLALRYAGVPDSKPVWTGSCPCQPFSTAAQQWGELPGFSDERHLWPAWYNIICQSDVSIIFGEQVTNAIRLGWLDHVFSDLEKDQHACAAAIMPANAVGADHERKRLYWTSYALRERHTRFKSQRTFQGEYGPANPFANYPFVSARNALHGNLNNVLFDNGLPISVEQRAIKTYGNAIVPQVAAEFIKATLDSIKTIP